MLLRKALFAALEPPVDADVFLEAVPELSLARGLEGSPYHHLDTLDHVLEVVRRVEEELEEGRLGARVPAGRLGGLSLRALLHGLANARNRAGLPGEGLLAGHPNPAAG